MLELYEATYMKVKGEVLLDEALQFTRTHLDNISKDPLRCDSTLSTHIQEALVTPIRRRLPRLEALRYIHFYQQQPSHDESLLKLAKLEFNLLQSIYKSELSQVSKYEHSNLSLFMIAICFMRIIYKLIPLHQFIHIYII